MNNNDIFKVIKREHGIAIQGINIPKGVSPNTVFFKMPSYGSVDYVCTPKRISIPDKLELDGVLLDVVEISGHPFEECDDLEELVIPFSVRKIMWNGGGRHHLSKIYVHPDNPVFLSVDGVLFTREGFNREGKVEPNCIELIAYPSAKGPEYSVPIGTTRLGNQSFKYTTISHLNLPDTLKEIGTNAFYGCSRLKELVLPSSVVKNEGSSNCKTIFIEKGN